MEKEKQKACLCDEPLCVKCLVVNCEDDDCSTHTKERKIARRRSLEESNIVQDMN